MKRRFCLCLAAGMLWPGIACAQNLTPAQMSAKAKARDVPEIPFDSVPNFLKLPLQQGREQEPLAVSAVAPPHTRTQTEFSATQPEDLHAFLP